MTEEEKKAHRDAIKKALRDLRDNIETLRDNCAEEITPHLKALGVSFEDDWTLYEGIEREAGINAESFFESVGYNMAALCEDMIFCETF